MGNELAIKLDTAVTAVIGVDRLGGFQDAFLVAEGISQLKQYLTDDMMKPVMELQGNILGFKTDKDGKGGYSVSEVRNCLISAVLMGLQPSGNQFNIISGQMYPTKEGMGYLLRKVKGLKYEIIPGVPVIDLSKKQGSVEMTVTWSMNNGDKETRVLPVVVKANEYMGTDAVIGKATRKARAWLFGVITGTEVVDADAEEIAAEVIEIKEEQYDWDDLKVLYELKKDKLTPTQKTRSEDIIDNQRKVEYKRLQDFLANK